MSSSTKLAWAVQNNAHWCDSLCRAHDVPGEFHRAYWINHGKVPPYIPKLISLVESERAEVLHDAARALVAAETAADVSVKDSFQSLDLAPLGFHVLFNATWIFRDSATAIAIDPAERLTWHVVQSRDELNAWEAAWRGRPASDAGSKGERVFPPTLLDQPDLYFLAGRLADTIVATAVLNRTGGVIGLSNVSCGVSDAGPLFPGCVRLTQALHPATPVVGYERGADLMAAEKAGFEHLHGLTVWSYERARP